MAQAQQPTFDQASHERLISILSCTDFGERYLALCARYPVHAPFGANRLDTAKVRALFVTAGVEAVWQKPERVVTFDQQQISGWVWEASLVIKRGNGLEPMLGGSSGNRSVGHTWLSLSIDAGARSVPPVAQDKFFPPSVLINRPQFDGDLNTMQRIVLDLVAFFREFKELMKQNW